MNPASLVFRNRCFWGGLIGVVIFLTGCQSPGLRITTHPDSLVSVTGPEGKLLADKQPTPVRVTSRFNSGDKLTILAVPATAGDREKYLVTKRQLTRSGYEKLPYAGSGNTSLRVLDFTLEKRPDLRIETEPPSAVTVTTPDGHTLVNSQSSPVKMNTDFRDYDELTIRAVPSSAALSREYQETVKKITFADYEKLPYADSGRYLKKLSLKLNKREYEQIRVIKLMLTPEKGWVGYVTEERAFREITEQGGAVPTRIIDLDDNIGIVGMAMEPEGNQVVYSAAVFDVSDLDIIKELRLDEHKDIPIRYANLQGFRLDGGRGIQHITDENFLDMYPSYTQDGKYLIFCSNRLRPGMMDILRTSADGRGGITNIYTDTRGARAVYPSQSTDGTIAFAIYPKDWRKPGEVQIWTIGGSNHFPTQVALGIQPKISPDGTHIAYIGLDGNLWVAGVDGRGATQLTSKAQFILSQFKKSLRDVELAQFKEYEKQGTLLRHYHPYSFPSWSPDGKHILYTSMEGVDPTGRPNDNIYIMSVDGRNQQQLTTNGSVDRYPMMSPDQEYVYFMSNRGLKWAIWRIRAPRGIN